MTRMRWPAPRNPKPYASLSEKSKQIGESGREARVEKFLRQKEDAAVLASMPAEASAIASATGLTIDHVGAALSRLKARGHAEKRGRQWWPAGLIQGSDEGGC